MIAANRNSYQDDLKGRNTCKAMKAANANTNTRAGTSGNFKSHPHSHSHSHSHAHRHAPSSSTTSRVLLFRVPVPAQMPVRLLRLLLACMICVLWTWKTEGFPQQKWVNDFIRRHSEADGANVGDHVGLGEYLYQLHPDIVRASDSFIIDVSQLQLQSQAQVKRPHNPACFQPSIMRRDRVDSGSGSDSDSDSKKSGVDNTLLLVHRANDDFVGFKIVRNSSLMTPADRKWKGTQAGSAAPVTTLAMELPPTDLRFVDVLSQESIDRDGLIREPSAVHVIGEDTRLCRGSASRPLFALTITSNYTIVFFPTSPSNATVTRNTSAAHNLKRKVKWEKVYINEVRLVELRVTKSSEAGGDTNFGLVATRPPRMLQLLNDSGHVVNGKREKNWSHFLYVPSNADADSDSKTETSSSTDKPPIRKQLERSQDLIVYSIDPHKIFLLPDTHSNSNYDSEVIAAHLAYESRLDAAAQRVWSSTWGTMKGSTPARRVSQHHFLSFFHSSGPFNQPAATLRNGSSNRRPTLVASDVGSGSGFGSGLGTTSTSTSGNNMMRDLTSTDSSHAPILTYVFGGYLFEAKPPFRITHISSKPIIHESFYDHKRGWAFKTIDYVVFPMSFEFDAFNNSRIFLSYGKNDRECWLARIDLPKLIDSLVPVQSHVVGASKLNSHGRIIPASFRRQL